MPIAGVLILSQIFLKAKYNAGHWAGAAICLAGLAILIVTDRTTADSSTIDTASSGLSSPLLGDSLTILGAILYASNNIAQEKLLGETSQLSIATKF